MKRIYLDFNATTPPRPEVLEAMVACSHSHVGNASSQHWEGRNAHRGLEQARGTVAQLLDAEPDQVFFTSGGTEANNIALLGLGQYPTLLCSSVEHPSVLDCVSVLAPQGNHLIPVDHNAVVDIDAFQRLIRQESSGLAAVMLVNNETGTLQPVSELARMAAEQGWMFHCDAVQAIGRIPVSFRRAGVTSMSLSGHKIHGPPGVGLLLCRDPRIRPLMHGGKQQRGVRPGTEPVALAVGLAKALELALAELPSEQDRLERLRIEFEESVLVRVPGSIVNGSAAARLNTSNIRFPGRDAQALVMALDLKGVACSTGSACSSGAATPSHVLLAMGLSESEARSSVRFSFGRTTTEEQIRTAAQLIGQVVRAGPRGRHATASNPGFAP